MYHFLSFQCVRGGASEHSLLSIDMHRLSCWIFQATTRTKDAQDQLLEGKNYPEHSRQKGGGGGKTSRGEPTRKVWEGPPI